MGGDSYWTAINAAIVAAYVLIGSLRVSVGTTLLFGPILNYIGMKRPAIARGVRRALSACFSIFFLTCAYDHWEMIAGGRHNHSLVWMTVQAVCAVVVAVAAIVTPYLVRRYDVAVIPRTIAGEGGRVDGGRG